VQFGEKLGVPTPLTRAIIDIGGAVCGTNFWETGRTLRQLGLADLSPREIAERVDVTGSGGRALPHPVEAVPASQSRQ